MHIKRLHKTIMIAASCGLVALASGCTSVGTTSIQQAAAKPENCSLDIYASADEIDHQYRTLCLIDSRTGSTLFHNRSGAAAVDHARKPACECGADAILVESTDTEGMSFSRWGQGKAIIRAIEYTDKTP